MMVPHHCRSQAILSISTCLAVAAVLVLVLPVFEEVVAISLCLAAVLSALVEASP